MTKALLLILFYFIQFSFTYGQSMVLRIGDHFSSPVIGQLLDSPNQILSTESLSGKLLILDFWNIHCKNCLAAMPKMDSLQQQFKSKLQIVAVTGNSAEQVNHLFTKIDLKKPSFPFVVGDTILSKLFPHEGDPLHVWINEKGTVVAITNEENTNPVTLSKYFLKEWTGLPRRWDYGIRTDQALLSESNSSILSNAFRYSVLFKSLEEYSSSNQIIENDSCIRVLNGNLFELYKLAYKKELYEFPINIFMIPASDRILLKVKNLHPFLKPREDELSAVWTQSNHYCYEMKTPSTDTVPVYRRMQEDLARYFPYTARVQLQKVKCIELVSTNMNQITSGDTSIKMISKKISGDKSVHSNSLAEWIRQLNLIYAWRGLPVIDRSGSNEKTTLAISSKLTDIDTLNAQLDSYQLKLVEAYDYVPMLVINDQ